MILEVWMPVKNLEEYFKVSNTGQIRSFDRLVNIRNGGKRLSKARILSQNINPKGYAYVTLFSNGKACNNTRLVHRIIAEAFIPNPDNKPQVNHKNGIRDDNRIENLEWCTSSENNQHAYDFLGRKALGRPIGWPSSTRRKVKCDTLDIVFDSVREAMSKLGVNNISEVCKGKYKHSMGLVFRYL